MAFAANAAAQMPCVPYEEAVTQLHERYGERAVARALDSGGNLVEIYRTRDGASWSLLVTRPDGLACLAGTGEGWQEIADAFGPGGRES